MRGVLGLGAERDGAPERGLLDQRPRAQQARLVEHLLREQRIFGRRDGAFDKRQEGAELRRLRQRIDRAQARRARSSASPRR